ncbi:MAG: glycosyltransferase family 4 protein [Victivallaceae bacterium]|jgi:glycosyltransferase involved in cell wall biosynthesis
MKNKIIQVPRRFVRQEWGGTETVIIETSHELHKLGYEVEIFTSKALSGISRENILGVPVRRFSYFYPRLGLRKADKLRLDMRGGNVFSLSFLFAIMFMRDIKVIHLHTGGFMGGFVRLVSRLRKIPYVLSIHGGALDLPAQQLKEIVAPTKGSFNWGKIFEIVLRCGRVNQDAAAIICVCENERELMARKYPQTKVAYVPNGVDVERFAAGDAARFNKKFAVGDREMLLYVGGFYPQKNHLLLLDAFAGIIETRPRTVLVLVGVAYDQAYYEKLISRIAALNISDSVILLPNLNFEDDTLIDAYAAASVFVFPSKYETFGIVALEAWAARKPVICGKVGGLVSFIRDNENGLFFDVDSAPDLRRKIELLLDDKALAMRLAQAGFAEVQNYSWSGIAGKIAAIYEGI